MNLSVKYSILLCVYNAKDRVQSTLQHIIDLDFPKNRYELIVVDNASTDGSLEYIKQLIAHNTSEIQVRFLTESNPGKQHALWKGFGACAGSYVVICDDDNWLKADYLNVADKTIDKLGFPVIMGGACSPVPEMAWDLLSPYFFSHGYWLSIGTLTLQLEDVTKKLGWVIGAGSIIPLSAIEMLESLRFKHETSMSRGLNIQGSEDVELCFALTLCGWRVYSQPELRFSHFIPAYRISESYIQGLKQSNELALPLLEKYIRMRQVLAHPKGFIRIRSAVLFWVRQPNRLNLEALIYSFFGKSFRYKKLPTHLVKINHLN